MTIRPHLSLTVSALGLRTLHHGRTCGLGRPPAFLSEDIGSLLKGGAKVCQQQLVNEVLAPLVTEFALNLGREVATPLQRGFNAGLLDRVQAVELRIRSSPSPDSHGCTSLSPQCRVHDLRLVSDTVCKIETPHLHSSRRCCITATSCRLRTDVRVHC